MRGEVKRAPAVTVARVRMTVAERRVRWTKLRDFHTKELAAREAAGDAPRAAEHRQLLRRCERTKRRQRRRQ